MVGVTVILTFFVFAYTLYLCICVTVFSRDSHVNAGICGSCGLCANMRRKISLKLKVSYSYIGKTHLKMTTRARATTCLQMRIGKYRRMANPG